MKTISKHIFLFSLMLMGLLINAQDNIVLNNLNSVPQSMQVNPSTDPNCRWYIAGPLLGFPFGSLYLNKSVNGPTFGDVLKSMPDGTVDVDLRRAIKASAKNNYVLLNQGLTFFDGGFMLLKRHYITLNSTEKINFNLHYTRDFLELLKDGNGAVNTIGRPVQIAPKINLNAYIETGVGYNYEAIQEKLWIGGRVKYITGLASFQTTKSDISVTTADTAYEISVKANAEFSSSGYDIGDTTKKEFNQEFLKKSMGNGSGYSIDLGATYKFHEKFTFYVSIIDLGMIKWKNNLANYSFSGDYRYTGNTLSQLLGGKMDSVTTASLKKAFTYTQNKNAYTTVLPTQFYLKATYNLSEKHRIGALIYSQILFGRPTLGGGVSFTSQIIRGFQTSVNYDIFNRSFANIGLGFAANLWPFQIYMATDNVLGIVTYMRIKTGDGGSILYPGIYKNANIRIGMNWIFGRKPKKESVAQTN